MQRIKIDWAQLCGSPAKIKPEEVYFTVAQFCLPELSRCDLTQTTVNVQDSQIFRKKTHKICQSEFQNDFWLLLKGVAMQQITDPLWVLKRTHINFSFKEQIHKYTEVSVKRRNCSIF